MKRICTIICLLALFLLFIGCSGSNPKDVSQTNLPVVSGTDTAANETSQADVDVSLDKTDDVRMGSTNGNILNEGYYAETDNLVYAGLSDGLYKYRNDGSGYSKICDDKVKYINVSGDWVYYVNITDRSLYKIKSDGTGRVKLEDDMVSAVVIYGDRIYYARSSTGMGYQLYSMKTDSSDKHKLSEDIVGDADEAYINIYDGWIYYWSGSNSDFCSMTTDGISGSKVSYTYANVDIEDGWIYYANGAAGRQLYKTNLKNSESVKISDDEVCLPVNVYAGWIYYFKYVDEDNCKLYKIKTDGTGRMELCEDEFPTYFGRRHGVTVNVAGSWVYINKYIADNALERIKVKTDGTEKQIISTDEIPVIYKKVDGSQRNELEKIAKQTIVDILEKNMGSDIPERQRLKDYKINNIKALNGDISYFGFSVDYSVQGAIENTDWVAGNGETGKNGWVLNKVQYYTLKKEGNSYKVESSGTSPTFPMIESGAMK